LAFFGSGDEKKCAKEGEDEWKRRLELMCIGAGSGYGREGGKGGSGGGREGGREGRREELKSRTIAFLRRGSTSI